MATSLEGGYALPIEAVPASYPARWFAALACAAVASLVIWAFAASPNIRWSAIGQYLFADQILKGLALTLVLTALAQTIGVTVGVVLAAMTISPNGLPRAVSAIYIWVFRGTPTLIQIIVWFNIGLVFPTIFFGIPMTGIGVTFSTNSVITPLLAAVIALGLNEAAYMAEIVRGGILAIDPGQREASASIGLNHRKTMQFVVLPQALRLIIPATGNELISMLKNTSLVSVIAANELMTSAQQIYAMNFLTIELLMVVSIWYLITTTLATIAQRALERYLNKVTHPAATSPAKRLQNLLHWSHGSKT